MTLVKDGLRDTAEDGALDWVQAARAADDQRCFDLIRDLNDGLPDGKLGLFGTSVRAPTSLLCRGGALVGSLARRRFFLRVEVALVRDV